MTSIFSLLVPSLSGSPSRQRSRVQSKLFAVSVLGVALLSPATAQAAGTWHPSVEVSAAGLFPQVAVDAQGNAVAVWTASNYIVQAATRSGGASPASARGGWSEPQSLSTPGQSAAGAQVGVDAQGNAVVVWSRFNGSNQIVQAASRPAGASPTSARGGWSEPQDLSPAGQDGRYPQIAVDAQGDAVAVWTGGDGGVKTASRPAGASPSGPRGGWSEPENLGRTNGGPETQVDVAQGNAVVAWTANENDTNRSMVRVATGTVGGRWDATKSFSGPETGAHDPTVAVDPQGNVALAWSRDVFPQERVENQVQGVIQAATRRAGGNWTNAQDLSTTDKNAHGVRVDLDARGNAVAVWSKQDRRMLGFTPSDFSAVIETASRPVGGGAVRDGWSAPQRLTPEEQTADVPALAVSPGGRAVAVWHRFEGVTPFSAPTVGRYIPVGAIRSADGGWSAPHDLWLPTAESGFPIPRPGVGIDPQGDAVTAWSARAQEPGSRQTRDQVRAAVYEDTSPPPGGGSADGGGGATGGGATGGGGSAGGGSSPAGGNTQGGTASGGGGPQQGGAQQGGAQPGGGQPGGGPGDEAGAREARRARALHGCLARVARHAKREGEATRRGSARQRARARRHMAGHRRAERRRCVARHGRTPGRVGAPSARAVSPSAVVLSFLASGSDGARAPAARRYVVKQSRRPIRNGRDFRRAQTLCAGACVFDPAGVGQRLSLTVTDLRPKTTYFYAIAARDNVSGRPGPRSRTVGARTR